MKHALMDIMPEEKAEDLMKVSQIQNLTAHSYFLRAGETPKKFAFIQKGLFRYVYINDKGNEFTKGLIPENQFITSYSAMISKSPSHFYIEALEDSIILTIPYEKWQNLLKEDIFWTHLLLSFVERGFSVKEKRERELLLLNAESRYRTFLEEFPDLENRIPQTIIASYLGIQPESLSRIKKILST